MTDVQDSVDVEPEIRDYFAAGVHRSQVTREIRRGSAASLLLVGLLVLAAVITLNVWRNVSRGVSPLADHYKVRVAVPDASGITPDVQEVRISGVPVGRITGIRLAGSRAVVQLSILKKFGPLYRDAKIRIRPQTPLNDMYADVIDRGTPSAGRLTASMVLPTSSTTVPVHVGTVLNTFDAPTRLRLQRFLDQLGPALGDHGNQLRQAFVEISPFLVAAQRLSGELATRRTVTRRLVHNLALMLDALADRDQQLRGLVDHGQRTLAALADNSTPLDAALRVLPSTLIQARNTFTSLPPTLRKARRAFTALMPVAKRLPDGLRALGSFSGDAAPAFKRLRPAVARLRTLMSQARPLSAGLSQAVSDLRPAAPRLDRVTAMVPACEKLLRNFFTDTLSVFKFDNGDVAIPRGELVVNAPGQYVEDKSCAPGRAAK